MLAAKLIPAGHSVPAVPRKVAPNVAPEQSKLSTNTNFSGFGIT